MITTVKLSKDENGTKVNEKLYQAMIKSLLYLMASRPDLCHSLDTYMMSVVQEFSANLVDLETYQLEGKYATFIICLRTIV